MKADLNQAQMIAQLQKMVQQIQASGAQSTGSIQSNLNVNPTNDVKPNEFGGLLNKAIDTVNQYQQESAQAARQVEAGDGGVSLVKAMIASQKASVAFQATVQVRNKVVSAYQDIMNMPI